MLKRLLFTIILSLVLLLGEFLYIITTCTSYSIYLAEPEDNYYSSVKIKYSEENIVSASEPTHEDGYYKITFNPLNQGSTIAEITCIAELNGQQIESRTFYSNLTVGFFNILYEKSNGNIPNISGYPVFYITMALFFCIMAVYTIILFKRRLKKNMYSYNTILNCSLMIVFIGMGIFFALFSIYILFNYRDHQVNSMHNIITIIMTLIIYASIPFVFIYSISMTISNISLIRHEGFRMANALGIIISIAMIVGVVVCIILPNFFYDSSSLIFQIVYSIMCSLYAFFEIFLLGTKVCGLIAAKHMPEYDKDYIIILGCGIKKDGTLLPLLKGRVDKAIEFYQKQLKTTGKRAVFVPSGGQGSDEVISEGEAMKRYLLEQGIPSEQIMPETESTSTLENMKFSKKLIGNDKAKVAFSTTNYHVFRSGIFSNQAGLKADGMGSKTRWYFWPNAFIREFVGLVVNQWKKIAVLVLLTIVALVSSVLLTY